ncbi:hypothetical protein PHYSODRAFT_333395 [Phytophthora sojae]|uniref:RxLR effector protein n=1 Tax=Phytophthora sojae (strain P6497) TaxID=1094619 RepID=G4ZP84_PHYSP|nr:hypothetical protein PHYSODRAFT_333395 [Phytophthora sojae]EGZ15124.1 hypothetical protein PHYSODRAFT_333395 [Phytophthora sojae]|eukprot:XP_009528873.1 hypothetical protein PHYSODRAFT_333395 [Phytophthora sojae]
MSLLTKWVKSLGSKITDSVHARYWLWRKQSTDDIFKKLKLDGGLDAMFSSPKLKTLSTYVDLVNKKNPDKKVSMAGIISKSYGDLALANKIEYVLNYPSQKRMAARLSLQQRENWKAEGKTAEQDFTMMKLDKAGDDLFQTPQLNSWFKYVMYAEKDANSAMMSVLVSRYGDDGLAKIFLNAQPRNRRMRWVSLKLETAMGNEWVRMGYTSEDLFKLLKLDEDVNKVLTNQALVTWIDFLGRYNAKNPEQKTTLIQTFTKFFGDEPLARMLASAKNVPSTEKMATRLQQAQFNQWLGVKSTDDVFKLLKLNGNVDNLLTNPNLSTWISYALLFNSKNPGKGTTMIQTFTKFFGREDLAKMLEAAKKVPKTEKLAKQFQAAQFKQWFRDGVKPPEIWKMLNMEKATWMTNPDAQIWRLYNAFYKANKPKVNA